jgi:hypothetical protein
MFRYYTRPEKLADSHADRKGHPTPMKWGTGNFGFARGVDLRQIVVGMAVSAA